MKKLLTLLAFSLIAASTGTAAAAPQADLWAHWEPHDEASTQTVEHTAWDDLLSRYLVAGSGAADGVMLFRYAAVSAEDRKALQDYLQRLSDTDVAALSRDEQRAYWINLYNALTVEVILQNYPLDSIRDINPSLFGGGPWEEKRFSVGGEEVSLDEIEHRILRPIWQDARIHYAVNCASIGCPNLAARAFTADNTEELLEAGARAYVNHPRGARVEGGRLIVSSIYEWFKVDFGGDDAGVIAHLRAYAEDDLKEMLADIDAIGDDEYDWSLNGAP